MPAPNRFFIIGLPRSGTTYLMDLLNSHPGILCAGELFNPTEAIGYEGPEKPTEGQTGRISEPGKLVLRNRQPVDYLRKYFESHMDSNLEAVGVKFMIGQNTALLENLHLFPAARIIYLYRPNKLAQISSFLRAIQTKTWAQRDVTETAPINAKFRVNLDRLFQLWHEFDTYDFLFRRYLANLPHQAAIFEYADMFEDGFEARLQDFLGVPQHVGLQAGLVKQNAPVVAERFENRAEVEDAMRQLGKAGWLGPEIPPRAGTPADLSLDEDGDARRISA